jgi:hypothetical protein
MGDLLVGHGFWEEVELKYNKASAIYLHRDLNTVSGHIHYPVTLLQRRTNNPVGKYII